MQAEPYERVCERLKQLLLTTFRPLLPSDRRYALVDYPDAGNLGDHAIWLGEKALLAQLGIAPVYQCSMKSYDRDAMAQALGTGVILMHGGGNFGDLYVYHDFRLRVLRDFPDNDVLLFPQTVMFYADDNLLKSAAAIAAHGKVTLCARDALSHHILARHFGAAVRIVLAPDMAFLLDPLPRMGAPRVDVLWLNRGDSEGSLRASSIAKASGCSALKPMQADLGSFEDGIAMALHGDLDGERLLITDWNRLQFHDPEAADRYECLDFDTRSRFCLERARKILSLGKVVITNRLHGHILCTRMGVPHVLLNNSYGKNLSHYETWSRPLDICRFARSPADAWNLANELLAQATT